MSQPPGYTAYEQQSYPPHHPGYPPLQPGYAPQQQMPYGVQPGYPQMAPQVVVQPVVVAHAPAGVLPPAEMRPPPLMTMDGRRLANRQLMDMSRGFLAHPGAPHQFRDTLPFTGEECCRLGEGFGYNANNAPPPYELVRRGVTQEEWNRFMQRFSTTVLPINKSGCTQTTCYLLSCAFCLIPFGYCCMMRPYQAAVRDWLQDFNKEVLNPRGMHGKFQTTSVDIDFNGSADGGNYHEEITWFAVALTPEESAILKEEVVLWEPECCSDKIQPGCCGTCNRSCESACCCCCGVPVQL